MTHTIDTPALLLDLDTLRRNLGTMQTHMYNADKGLRPHAKTHKSSRLAHLQLQSGAVGICTAKLSEAEALHAAGVHDLLVTGPLATETKAARAARLAAANPQLLLVIESERQASLFSAAARNADCHINVLLDVDPGSHRHGVPIELAAGLARTIDDQPRLRLRGIQAYAGSVQHITAFSERRTTSLDAMGSVAALFREIRPLFHGEPVFTGGGTGSHDIDVEIPEITDIQAGSYALMDCEYLDVRSSGESTGFIGFPPSLSLLTTVISAHHDGFVTVDAGLKTLYQDAGPPRVISPGWEHLRYGWNGDEYGTLRAGGGEPLPREGDTIRLLPPHCDPTVNLHKEFIVMQNGIETERWPIDLRGCSQ